VRDETEMETGGEHALIHTAAFEIGRAEILRSWGGEKITRDPGNVGERGGTDRAKQTVVQAK
jgi:hypothetical protein